MSISTFDMFKIGIGPSSSHTVGPMRAAAQFAHEVLSDPETGPQVAEVEVHLYGSLAATGEGHGTLSAIVMGLEGSDPETVDPVAAGSVSSGSRPRAGCCSTAGMRCRCDPPRSCCTR